MEGAGSAAVGEVPGAEGLAERGVFGKPVAGMENPKVALAVGVHRDGRAGEKQGELVAEGGIVFQHGIGRVVEVEPEVAARIAHQRREAGHQVAGAAEGADRNAEGVVVIGDRGGLQHVIENNRVLCGGAGHAAQSVLGAKVAVVRERHFAGGIGGEIFPHEGVLVVFVSDAIERIRRLRQAEGGGGRVAGEDAHAGRPGRKRQGEAEQQQEGKAAVHQFPSHSSRGRMRRARSGSGRGVGRSRRRTWATSTRPRVRQ